MLEEYMTDIGYTNDEINIIRNTFINYSSSTILYNLKNMYNFFRRSGVNNKEFIYITTTSPNILLESIENIKQKILELNSFGFTKISSFNILKTYPYILDISNQKIKNKFDKLYDFGFHKDDILIILSNNASLFGIDYSSIKKRLQLFLDYGYSPRQVINIVTNVPSIIDTNISNIQKKFIEYEKLGFKKSDIIKISYYLPELMVLSIDSISLKLNDLDNFGYSLNDIISIVKKVPIVLKDYYLNKIIIKLNCLSELGFSKEEIINITCSNPYILLYSEEMLIERFNNLLYFEYSLDDIRKLIINLPILFGYDINTISKKIKYYDSINLKSIIINDTSILLYPLELIEKRYNFISKSLSINTKNYNLLFLSDKDFYKKYKITKEELLKDGV